MRDRNTICATLDRTIPNVYRIFFPLGLFFGILGVSAWIPNLWQSIPTYPVQYHSRVMIDGFLFCFVFGFLGTAIPRMTASFPAKVSEVLIGLLSVGCFGVSLIFDSESLALTASFIGYFGIVLIGVRRLRARSKNPPAPFIFIATTLIIAILCKLMSLFAYCEVTFFKSVLPSVHGLYLHSTATGLILGAGFFLVPVLLGTPGSLQREPEGEEAAVRLANQNIKKVIGISFVIYLISVFLELFFLQAAYALRGLAIAMIAYSRWNLHRWPHQSGVQGKGIYFSCWMLLIGHFAVAFYPHYASHVIHIIYILSVSLMILMVATRVILAHEGLQRQLERRSVLMWLIIACLFISGATRVFAPVIPVLYLSHLAYASLFWIFAIVLWAVAIWRQAHL